jgi:hypothetical protein
MAEEAADRVALEGVLRRHDIAAPPASTAVAAEARR